jgi:ABC-type oligopeptide transport system substrate-binding subunit
VRANLARIGIDVTIQAVPYSVFVARIGHRDAGYDMVFNSWFADFPDAEQFLAFQAANNSFFDDSSYDRRLDAAAQSTGADRIASYAQLDTDLAGKASPMIAFGVGLSRDLFSARIGCQVFQPAAGGMDLTALCLNHR